MDEAVLRLRVGLFVLIALVILGILIFLNSEGWQSQYTIYIKPERAPGVTVNTPIRKNGILIGRVASVQTQDDHVLLGLRIDQDERIYENETCSIGAESFLGDSVVEVLPLRREDRGNAVTENHVMKTVSVKRNPMEIVDVALNLEDDLSKTMAVFREAGSSVNKAGQGIEKITNTVQNAISDEKSDLKKLITDVQLMSRKAQAAADNFNTFFDSMNKFINDPENEAQFRNAIKELPEILTEVRKTVADTRLTINSYREVSKSASANFDNLKPFTESLKSNGPAIVNKINESLGGIDKLVEDVKLFTKNFGKFGDNIGNALNDPNSSVNRLLKDKEIFVQIETIVRNVRELSDKLEPIGNDARTFVDSIARDPSQLGIRGAIKRGTPGNGYKGTAGRDRVIRE